MYVIADDNGGELAVYYEVSGGSIVDKLPAPRLGFARGLRKPVISLETPELQMQSLRFENRQDRNAMWRNGLASWSQAGPWNCLSEMWAESRLDELQRYAEWCECLDTGAERREWRRTVDDRNLGLADSIITILDSGQTVFAAVGSFHMIGATGPPHSWRSGVTGLNCCRFHPNKVLWARYARSEPFSVGERVRL